MVAAKITKPEILDMNKGLNNGLICDQVTMKKLLRKLQNEIICYKTMKTETRACCFIFQLEDEILPPDIVQAVFFVARTKQEQWATSLCHSLVPHTYREL